MSSVNGIAVEVLRRWIAVTRERKSQQVIVPEKEIIWPEEDRIILRMEDRIDWGY